MLPAVRRYGESISTKAQGNISNTYIKGTAKVNLDTSTFSLTFVPFFWFFELDLKEEHSNSRSSIYSSIH